MFTELCNYDHDIRTVSLPQEETLYSLAVSMPPKPSSPVPNPCVPKQPLLFCFYIDLPILDISYKRDHMMCGLMCLASFT